MKHHYIYLLFLIIITTAFNFREVLYVSQTSKVINTITSYTFMLDRRQNNSFSTTPYLTTPVSTNATVTFTFPSTFTINSSATCVSITVDSVAINSFTCSVSGNTIIFGNVFTNISNLNVGLVTLTVGNILNPTPAIAVNNFAAYIGIDYAVPSGVLSIQLTAGALQSCSITFSPGYVNQATSVMIATMTPSDPHPVGSTLVIQFPRSYWINDISSQTLPITSTMTCSNNTGNINSGILCTGTPSTNLITASSIFSSTTTSTFGIRISNFLSPPSNQPSDAIVMTTYQSGFRLDTCTVYPTGLIPIPFSSFTVSSTTTLQINQLISLRFDMYPTMAINQSDYFSLTFPTGTTYTYNAIFGTGYYLSPPSFSGQTVYIYPDPASSASSYAANTLYSLTFASFTAPPSTLPTSAITLQILRNGYPIMYGTSTLTATSSTLSASVAVTNRIVWASTTYTFTITTSNPLSNTGMIQITFPPTVTPPSSATCASLIGTSLNSNPTCSLNIGSNSIYISNINASSTVTTIPAQGGIVLSINGVINPPDTSTTDIFTITTYYTSNTQGVVDVGTASGVTPTQGTISINTVSVIPSSYIAMQSGVTYSINFNNTYRIPINGYIVVQIPLDISIVTAQLPNYCRLSINNANYSSTTCSVIITSTYYQVSFTSPAQTTAISANSYISLQILSICTNPTNTRIVTPFAINTYSSSASIQSRTTGITVQMQTPASFSIIQVTRSSQQNSASNIYTITLKQQAALPLGTLLLINFPTQISLTASSLCKDLTNINLNCTLGSFHSIQITLNSISSNTQFGVIISNVTNPPSYKPTATSFTFQTKTSDLVSTYAYGTYSTPFTNSVPSIFQQVTPVFSPGAYGSSQTLTLTVTPSTYIVPSSYLVSLATSFTPFNLTCGSQVGFSGNCTQVPPSGISVSGSLGSSQVSFSISGFTSPSYVPTDYTFLSSYDSFGYLIDQNTTTILYSLACPIPCKTCISNTSNCLSCYNNPNISLSNLYFAGNYSCITSCPTGYYQSTSLICVACSTICLTCTASPSNCASCNSTSSYPALYFSNSTGTCMSTCPTYYYLTTSILPNQCTPCISPCYTCTGLNVCLSCVPNYFYYNLTCSLQCPSNISIANNITHNCDLCSSQCATCLGTVSSCTGCSSTAIQYNNACLTSCPYPLVISGGTCANCSTNCSSCSLTATNCTSCSITSGTPYLFNPSTTSGICMTTCPFQYYGDSAQGLCKSCISLNISCKNCSSTITCYNCDYGSGRVFYNNQCLSNTPIGYYNNSGIATPCNSTCSSCQSANNCTSCVSLSLSNNQCVQTCPNYQVSVNKECKSCTFPCLGCYNLQNNCTSCNSTLNNSYYLLSGSCIPTCPNYTFPNPNGWLCSACISPCQMCSTNASCLSCANGYYLYNQTCNLTCPLGFVGLNKICQACTNNCSSCTGSASNCLTCKSGTYLYNSSSPSCSSTCPTGLWPNPTTQTCTGCSAPCQFCNITSNNCTSCLSGYFQANQCVPSCSVGYYLLGSICFGCNSTCTACTSALICSSCSYGFYLSGSSCVSSCPPTAPNINNASQCTSCSDPYCLNCSSNNYCYQCFYPKVFYEGACLASCPYGYIMDVTLKNCTYSPSSFNTSSASTTLSNSLISTSIFPVPFTIGAIFIIIACLMSRFQHQRTDLIASIYSLWGLLQWAAIAFLIAYYWINVGTVGKLSYLLVVGGFLWIHLFNLIFIMIQCFSFSKNKRFNLWLEGSINSCWYHIVTFISLATTTKLKFILFCKLFNFRVFSAKLDTVGGLRVLHAYTFSCIIASVATISGGIYLLIQSKIIVNQLLMAEIDVVVLSVLQLILGFCNIKKDDDYFEDIDEDGLIINKRIEIRSQDHPGGVMPQYGQSDRDSYRYKALQSAKKLQSSYLSQISNHKSFRDISIQAESILGERSLISRLGTQTISELSLFDRQDVSIQMDPVRDVQDVSVVASQRKMHDVSIAMSEKINLDASVAVSEHKGRHDVSIGQSNIFQDASVNHSLDMQDVSVYADRVSRRDVSIDQTQKFNEQVSIQFEPQGHEISIQMDEVQQNQISVQYVPIYTDQTVHMTRQEEELGIQCNADQQNISIQYSAKPLIQRVDGILPSQTSQFVDEPSDLDLQRRLILHPPAPQQTGLRVQLQLDIQQRLQRKKKQLEKLQQQRKQRQRQQIIREFQNKIEKKQISIQINPKQFIQENIANDKNNQNPYGNDNTNSKNSLVKSSQELSLNLQERVQEQKQQVLQPNQQQKLPSISSRNFKKKIQHSQSIIYQNEVNKNKPQFSNHIEPQSLMIFNQQFNNQEPYAHVEVSRVQTRQQQNNNKNANNTKFQNSRLKTQQQFLQMLSGNQSQTPIHFTTKQSVEKRQAKVQFETANNIIENQQEFIEQDDLIENDYQPLELNPPQNHISAQKSRSTFAITTNRPPLPQRYHQNMLQSENEIEKSYEDQDEIINKPMNPKLKDIYQPNKNYRRQQEKSSKTNLTQFLQKKRKKLISQGDRRNNLMEQDDVLSKQLEKQFKQKPLPPPKAEVFRSDQSFSSQKRSIHPTGLVNRQLKRQIQINDDLLSIEAQKFLSKPPNNLPRSKSKNKIQIDVGIERASKQRPNFLRETYSSEQKKKSLQKIYLNKVIKK